MFHSPTCCHSPSHVAGGTTCDSVALPHVVENVKRWAFRIGRLSVLQYSRILFPMQHAGPSVSMHQAGSLDFLFICALFVSTRWCSHAALSLFFRLSDDLAVSVSASSILPVLSKACARNDNFLRRRQDSAMPDSARVTALDSTHENDMMMGRGFSWISHAFLRGSISASACHDNCRTSVWSHWYQPRCSAHRVVQTQPRRETF